MLSCVTASSSVNTSTEEVAAAAMIVAATDYNLFLVSTSDENNKPSSDQVPVSSSHTALTSHTNYTKSSSTTPQSPPFEDSTEDSTLLYTKKSESHSQFIESLDDIATDIIICTLVAAFVALQYRDIIRTCEQ